MKTKPNDVAVLALPRGKSYTDDTDSFIERVGCVRSQEHQDGAKQLIGYWSPTIKPLRVLMKRLIPHVSRIFWQF